MTVESQPGPGWWIDPAGTPRPPNEHPDAAWRERWGGVEQPSQTPPAPADTPEAPPENAVPEQAVPEQPVPPSVTSPEIRQADDGRWQRRGADGYWYFADAPSVSAQQAVEGGSDGVVRTSADDEPTGVERAAGGHPEDCLYCDFEKPFEHRYTPRGNVRPPTSRSERHAEAKRNDGGIDAVQSPAASQSHRLRWTLIIGGAVAAVLAIVLPLALSGHTISWKDGYAFGHNNLTSGLNATPTALPTTFANLPCTHLKDTYVRTNGDTAQQWDAGCVAGFIAWRYQHTHPGSST